MKLNKKSDTELEKSLNKALKSFGLLFPSTEEEVIEYEKRCGNTEIIMPEDLREPDFLYSNERSLKVVELKFDYENVALAARESMGNSIPNDVRERMNKDRAAAIKKHKK
jgi:hypothetical protein